MTPQREDDRRKGGVENLCADRSRSSGGKNRREISAANRERDESRRSSCQGTTRCV